MLYWVILPARRAIKRIRCDALNFNDFNGAEVEEAPLIKICMNSNFVSDNQKMMVMSGAETRGLSCEINNKSLTPPAIIPGPQ